MKHKARCCFLLKVRQSSRQDDVSDGRESEPRDGKPSKVTKARNKWGDVGRVRMGAGLRSPGAVSGCKPHEAEDLGNITLVPVNKRSQSAGRGS